MPISKKVRKGLAAWPAGQAADEACFLGSTGKFNILDVINDSEGRGSGHSDFCPFPPQEPSARTQSKGLGPEESLLLPFSAPASQKPKRPIPEFHIPVHLTHKT